MRTLTLEEAKFSSPLGDFVFYITDMDNVDLAYATFSSPLGDFVFYIIFLRIFTEFET